MHVIRSKLLAAGLALAALAVVACGGDGDGGNDDAAGEAEPTVTVAQQGDLAPYLVGPDGRTLYYFADDAEGVSNCEGSCLESWPPLLLEDGAEPAAPDGLSLPLSVIERSDGRRQVAYGGRALYYWAGDTAPGETSGHGVGGVWFVAASDGSLAQPAANSDAAGTPAAGGAGSAGDALDDYDYGY